MAHVLIMPRQGNTVESCIIVGWKKKEGDAVHADTPVCEVETDKATFEVLSGVVGVILKILHEEGDDVPVLQPIAVIGEAGENWQTALGSATGAVAGSIATTKEDKATVTNPVVSPAAVQETTALVTQIESVQRIVQNADGFTAISPRARNKAFAEAVDISRVHGSGPAGRIIEADINDALASHAPLTAAAKAELRSSGVQVQLPQIGSGIGGRVTRTDIEAIAASAQKNAKTAVPKTGGLFTATAIDPEFSDTPIKGIRKVIAEKMCKSLETTAQFTLNASASAVRIQELRKRYKESKSDYGVSGVTINDLILFAASRTLPKYPYMNAHKLDGVLRTFNTVHLGVAVDTPKGLMVPVIRNAEHLSLSHISAQAKALAAACIEGTIRPEQLSGSTITISNLGNTGIESFTPVLNIPEVAILGVCGIQPKPVQKTDGSFGFEPHISFSLTIDHAAVDGSPAAKFLQGFCDAVKNIDVLLAQ